MRTISAALAITLLAVIVGNAVAQPSVWEGKFVAGADGSVWAVKEGVRHRVQASLITESELAALPEGQPVSTIAELMGSSETASVSAPQAVEPLSPPATLLGQAPKICRDGTPIRAQVLEAQWTQTLGSGAGTTIPGANWVSIVLNATNEGTEAESLYQSTQLRDERGRTWGDVGGTASASHIGYQQLATMNGAELVTNRLRPGLASRVLLVFSVADDVQSLELLPVTAAC